MSSKYNLPCVIFAGGKSSRMQTDKSLLPFGDAPTLTHYLHEKMSKLFNRVYIACKSADKFALDANYILDPDTKTYAPTLGFIASFKSLEDEAFFAISVDTPFVDTHVIESLMATDTANVDATIAKTAQGIHPLCGIYHRSLLPSFETMYETQHHKLGQLLHDVKTHFVAFEDETPFTNLNHPQEYEDALKQLQ